MRRKPGSACGCFVAGTIVWTLSGPIAIEQVEPGMLVVTRDEATGALVARVIVSRVVPPDMVLLLDSTRIEVPPLAGRSFHFKPIASLGDSVKGQVIGEYTLEMRNENAHGLVKGLTAG